VSVRVVAADIPDILIVEPEVHRDERGVFVETYRADAYRAAGIGARFVQDNHSRSVARTLRGLHLQVRRPQAKLIRVTEGEVFDVAVDVRLGSPTFGRWVGLVLSADTFRQCYIPAGFAHGFCVPAVVSEMEYKCTDFYHPEDESGVIWNDPAIGIAWPIRNPVLSQKDAGFPPLTPERRDLPPYPE